MTLPDVLALLREAKGDPERLTLATVEALLSTRKPGLREALEAAAVLHSFNTVSLGCLLAVDPPQLADLTEELASLPIVEPYPARGGWNVHQATRLAMRHELRTGKPELFQSLSALAATCSTGDAFADRIEAVYHRLSSDPAQAADDLERLYRDCDDSGQHEAIDSLATILDELCTFPLADSARGRVLLTLGWIRLYRRPLATTEPLSQEAFEILKGTGPQGAIADSHILQGLVLERNGLKDDALKLYLAGQKIMEDLVTQPKSDRSRQRDLANTGTLIARIYAGQERFDEAHRELEKSQSLLERLIGFEPDNVHWKRELAVVHSDLGRIHESRQEFAKALAEFEVDKQINKALAASEPQNPDLRCELAVCHNNIGRIYQQQALFTQALEEYHQYNAIMDDLTSMEPANLVWQRELAVSYLCVGNTYSALGKSTQEEPAAALAAYDAVSRILRSLIELDEDNARTQRDLYDLHYRRGQLYLDHKKFSEARDAFERCKQIIERLHDIAPDDKDYLRALSLAYHKIGRTYEGQGEYDSALVAYRLDMEIAEKLVALDPSNPKWRQELEVSLKAIKNVSSKGEVTGETGSPKSEIGTVDPVFRPSPHPTSS